MNCDEISPHISELLDRAIAPELARVVEGHISLCASCRFTFEQLQSLRVALRSVPTRMPSEEMDWHVITAFRRHHRREATVAAAFGWRRLILGSVGVPKMAVAIAVVAVTIALVGAFNAGRIAASRAVHNVQPQVRQVETGPNIAEVPIKREQIVYVKAPGSRTRGKSRLPRPTSAELANDPPAARLRESSVDDLKPAAVSLGIKSLEDFEPIRGAIGRVIEGSKHK